MTMETVMSQTRCSKEHVSPDKSKQTQYVAGQSGAGRGRVGRQTHFVSMQVTQNTSDLM